MKLPVLVITCLLSLVNTAVLAGEVDGKAVLGGAIGGAAGAAVGSAVGGREGAIIGGAIGGGAGAAVATSDTKKQPTAVVTKEVIVVRDGGSHGRHDNGLHLGHHKKKHKHGHHD